MHWYWRHGTEREAPTLHQQRVTLGVPAVGTLLDRDAIAFAFLIVVLMLRPQGLLGKA